MIRNIGKMIALTVLHTAAVAVAEGSQCGPLNDLDYRVGWSVEREQVLRKMENKDVTLDKNGRVVPYYLDQPCRVSTWTGEIVQCTLSGS